MSESGPCISANKFQTCRSRLSTCFLDEKKKIYAYRARTTPFVQDLLEEFTDECRRYMEKCGDLSDLIAMDHARGWHWFMVIGVDRQNKQVSVLCECAYVCVSHCEAWMV